MVECYIDYDVIALRRMLNVEDGIPEYANNDLDWLIVTSCR